MSGNGVKRQDVKRHFRRDNPDVLRLTIDEGDMYRQMVIRCQHATKKDAREIAASFSGVKADAFYAIVMDEGRPGNGGVGAWIQVSSATGEMPRKYHIWLLEAKVFFRSMIQPLLDKRNTLLSYFGKVRTLWDVLTNEAIGVLIRTAFPGRVRVCKVGSRLQLAGDLLVMGEFLAVVKGDGHGLEATGL